jgi:hypothetical protein
MGMGRHVGRRKKDPIILTYHILGEPDPTVAINVDTYTNAV